VTTPQQERAAAAASSSGGNRALVAAEESNTVADVLENTLWNRQLGAMSEEIVAALVCQIFEGTLFDLGYPRTEYSAGWELRTA
jgi:hypothetical protein